MEQTTQASPEQIALPNAPQFTMPTKIIAEDIKVHATIKSRANHSLDALMNDIYQSAPSRRGELSESALDALNERIREYRAINECVKSIESFITQYKESLTGSTPSDHGAVTYEVALKLLGLLTSPHVSHEFRMATLIKYPMPLKFDMAFDSVLSSYGKAMEPYWVEVEMLVQKYHIRVDSTVSDTKPWWKFW